MHLNLTLFMLKAVRTTIDIPDDLMEEARRASRAHTKRETVLAGLQELIRSSHIEELRRWAGRVNLDIDLARSRKRRRT